LISLFFFFFVKIKIHQSYFFNSSIYVGSTSIPGLCAKPIIDMLLIVEDSADESSYLPILEAAGYTLHIREPEWLEHRVFKGPVTDINLHVFSKGTSEIDRMLLFQDWLRIHKADRDKYARVKKELAKNKFSTDLILNLTCNIIFKILVFSIYDLGKTS